MSSPLSHIFSYIPNPNVSEKQHNCPLEALGDKTDAFFMTDFFKLRCRYMPCNGRTDDYCAECWKIFDDERNGVAPAENSYTIDTKSNECPVVFCATMRGKINPKFFGPDDVAYNKCLCTSVDVHRCRRLFARGGACACWTKLMAAKGIHR